MDFLTLAYTLAHTLYVPYQNTDPISVLIRHVSHKYLLAKINSAYKLKSLTYPHTYRVVGMQKLNEGNQKSNETICETVC